MLVDGFRSGSRPVSSEDAESTLVASSGMLSQSLVLYTATRLLLREGLQQNASLFHNLQLMFSSLLPCGSALEVFEKTAEAGDQWGSTHVQGRRWRLTSPETKQVLDRSGVNGRHPIDVDVQQGFLRPGRHVGCEVLRAPRRGMK